MNQDQTIDHYAKIIWDYMLMKHDLKKSDIILCLGSRDVLPAIRAVELYIDGYAEYIMFSGNHGQNVVHEKPEAEVYRDIAISMGVPEVKVIVENQSTNTGENIKFSRIILEKMKIPYSSILLVQKPYMERRAYATFKKNWSDPEVSVTSPQIGFEEYCLTAKNENKERIINRMVGDLLRIKEYPKLGFQIEQDIPDDVWQAGQKLLEMGFDKYKI